MVTGLSFFKKKEFCFNNDNALLNYLMHYFCKLPSRWDLPIYYFISSEFSR